MLSFLAMYILMYSMVNAFANVFSNMNQFYMAALMAAPMVLIELLLMSSMYLNKKLNTLIGVVSARADRFLVFHPVAGGPLGQAISAINDPASHRSNSDV